MFVSETLGSNLTTLSCDEDSTCMNLSKGTGLSRKRVWNSLPPMIHNCLLTMVASTLWTHSIYSRSRFIAPNHRLVSMPSAGAVCSLIHFTVWLILKLRNLGSENSFPPRNPSTIIIRKTPSHLTQHHCQNSSKHSIYLVPTKTQDAVHQDCPGHRHRHGHPCFCCSASRLPR